MPYQPNITDISGQLRAAGMVAAGKSLGGGLGDLGEGIAEGMRAYKQNQMMTSQAMGKFDAIAHQDPSILQFLESDQAPTETSKIYQKMKKDGALGVKDAAQLAVFADTFANQKKQAAEDDLRKQQAAMLVQQIAMQKEEMARKLRDQGALMGAARQFLPTAPQSTMGNAIQGGASFEQLPDRDTVIPGQPAQPFDPAKFGMSYFLNRGSPESADKVDTMVKMMSSPGKPQKLITPSPPYMETGPDGKTYVLTRDEMTGAILSRALAPKPYESPEEAVERTKKTEEVVGQAKEDQAFLTGVTQAAAGAQSNLRRYERTKELYNLGAKSGWGQAVINDITGALVRVGLYPADKQAKKEELQALLSTDSLEQAKQFYFKQGPVSDPERVRIDKVAQGIGKSEGANLAALRLSKALHYKALEMETERRKLVDEGKSRSQVAEHLRRWQMDHPLSEFEDEAPDEPDSIDPVQAILDKYKVGSK